MVKGHLPKKSKNVVGVLFNAFDMLKCQLHHFKQTRMSSANRMDGMEYLKVTTPKKVGPGHIQ